METTSINLLWWISAFELPVLATLFGMVIRNRNLLSNALNNLKEALGNYKLEVAKSYASLSYLNAVEKRLTEHLLRIEKKLDKQF